MFWKGILRRLTTPNKDNILLEDLVGVRWQSKFDLLGSIRVGKCKRQSIAAKKKKSNTGSDSSIAAFSGENGSLRLPTISTYGSGKDIRRERVAEGQITSLNRAYD